MIYCEFEVPVCAGLAGLAFSWGWRVPAKAGTSVCLAAPSFPRKRESVGLPRKRESASLSPLLQQVLHLRIFRPDQVNFPLPIPSLYPGFSQNCITDIQMYFVIYQDIDIVSGTEYGSLSRFMCYHPPDKIGGDPSVKYGAVFIGQNIDIRCFHTCLSGF